MKVRIHVDEVWPVFRVSPPAMWPAVDQAQGRSPQPRDGELEIDVDFDTWNRWEDTMRQYRQMQNELRRLYYEKERHAC